jgi:hypothetical protein
MVEFLAFFLLFLSLAANAAQFYKAKKSKTNSASSHDSRMLLADILRGDALVRITRIAPEDVFLRSPRGIA